MNPRTLLLGATGIGIWATSIALTTNYQKKSSPFVRDLIFTLRNTPQVTAALGDDLEPGAWFKGSINQFKGVADLEFSLTGSRDRGDVTVKAHRRDQEWSLDQVILKRAGLPDERIQTPSLANDTNTLH